MVLIRITIRIQEFSMKFFYFSTVVPIVRINLRDQRPWLRFALSECPCFILRPTHTSLANRSAAALPDTPDFRFRFDADVAVSSTTMTLARCCGPLSRPGTSPWVVARTCSCSSCPAVTSALRAEYSTLESDSIWIMSFCDDAGWKTPTTTHRQISSTGLCFTHVASV